MRSMACWMWGWANPSGFPQSLTTLSTTLRDFGGQNDIVELTTAEVPFDVLPGAPEEPAPVVGIFIDVAKAVTNHWTAYNGDAGGGTRVAFLIEHPDFHLPPPEPARVMSVIQQALAQLLLTDHRRTLHSYAVRRGLEATFSPDYSQLTLAGPGFQAVAEFDRSNRVSNIHSSMSSPHGA